MRDQIRKIEKELRRGSSAQLFVVSYFAKKLKKLPVNYVGHCERGWILQVSPVFKSQMAEFLSGSGQLTFYLSPLEAMFKASLREIDLSSGELRVELPFDIVFDDRRKNKRIILQQDLNLLYNYDKGGMLRKRVFDLSLGGLVLVFSAMESCSLKINDILKHVHFSYENQFQYIDLKVLHIMKPKKFEIEAMPYAAKRVALQFVSLSLEQRAFVEQVLEIENSLQARKSS